MPEASSNISAEVDATAILSDFIEARYNDFMHVAQSVVSSINASVRAQIKSTYRGYLSQLMDDYSHAKSFFIRAEPAYLYTFYIPLGLKLGNKVVALPEMTHIANHSRATVIIASAGSGKSVFMKHLLLNSIIDKWKVPLFIELRNLNDSELNLEDFIFSQVSDTLIVERSVFDVALQRGVFVLLLDGLDETKPDRRKILFKELVAVFKKYDQLHIVLSSRPDSSLEALPNYSTAKLQPLSLVQAITLIQKLPFDSDVKNNFIVDLEKTLYEQHKSFASNPLLLSIMLLTYGQSLSIPNKVSVFYNQAYEALFERHDALKGGFKRERRTSLDIQDFARVFSAFCLHSFDERRFQFTSTDCLHFVEKALTTAQIACVKEDFVTDAKEAVGLLVDEGLNTVFPHRSFQEYFAARYIAETSGPLQQRLIERFKPTFERDNLHSLLYEMRPEAIERWFIRPELEKLFRYLGVNKKIGMTHYLKYIKYTMLEYEIVDDNLSGTLNNTYYWEMVNFCLHRCGHLVQWEGFSQEEPRFSFGDKYGAKFEVKVSKLTPKSPFLKDLFAHGRYMSAKPLEAAHRVLKALGKKEQIVAESLDAVLSKRT